MPVANGVKLGAQAEHGGGLAAGPRSLADVLASGPLPLPVALGYARQIASGAAVFHRGGRAHGALAPACIAIGIDGPVLLPANGMSHSAAQSSDLRDFGLLLHQMLTGLDPGGSSAPAEVDCDLETSPETVRSAALRLAERCRCAPGESDLRHVSTELRLLEIMINSLGSGEIVGATTAERTVDPPTVAEAPAKPAKSRASEVGCPSCGSSQFFPAHRLTILEKLLAVADLKTYRCYGCCHRFINVFGLCLPRPENE